MVSLFIISLPRSLSSYIYKQTKHALNFKSPIWTSDGEILNNDRFVFYNGQRFDEGLKFTLREQAPDKFEKICNFLEEICIDRNYIYKDVIQPFVMEEWLSNKKYKVLKIERSLVDVAYSVIKKGWTYPLIAARSNNKLEVRLIEGLIRAKKAIEKIQGASISYENLIYDEKYLHDALTQLYPGKTINSIEYINDQFCFSRDLYLKRRKTEKYLEVKALVEKVQNDLFS